MGWVSDDAYRQKLVRHLRRDGYTVDAQGRIRSPAHQAALLVRVGETRWTLWTIETAKSTSGPCSRATAAARRQTPAKVRCCLRQGDTS